MRAATTCQLCRKHRQCRHRAQLGVVRRLCERAPHSRIAPSWVSLPGDRKVGPASNSHDGSAPSLAAGGVFATKQHTSKWACGAAYAR